MKAVTRRSPPVSSGPARSHGPSVRAVSAWSGRTMKKRILVVDDERWFTNLVEYSLEPRGTSTSTKKTTRRTRLQAMRDFGPDLVILDIMMPHLDGSELAARIKVDPMLRDVPVIFMTALVTESKPRGPRQPRRAYVPPEGRGGRPVDRVHRREIEGHGRRDDGGLNPRIKCIPGGAGIPACHRTRTPRPILARFAWRSTAAQAGKNASPHRDAAGTGSPHYVRRPTHGHDRVVRAPPPVALLIPHGRRVAVRSSPMRRRAVALHPRRTARRHRHHRGARGDPAARRRQGAERRGAPPACRTSARSTRSFTSTPSRTPTTSRWATGGPAAAQPAKGFNSMVYSATTGRTACSASCT